MGNDLVLRAMMPLEEQHYEAASRPHTEPSVRNPSRPISGGAPEAGAPAPDARTVGLIHALRCLHLLFRSERLYERNHPRRLQSLDTSYEVLRDFANALNGIEIHIERGGLVVPKLSDAHLPDVRGEMQSLALDLQRAGIQSLAIARQFHVGELDTLAQLFKASLLRSEDSIRREGSSWWAARFLEKRVEGISINTQTERKVDTVLASLMGALVAYGGNSPRELTETPILPPEMEDLAGALRLIARLTPPLEAARGLSPEEAARAIHGAMEDASRETVRMLLSSISQYAPREGERPQPYLLRLSESLILEFLGAEFSAGTLAPAAVRQTFHRLCDVLVSSGGYTGPHSSQHLTLLATTWATDTHREQILEKFWLELPAREKSVVLRGPEVWCVPVVALKRTLGQLAEAGADAPRREARNILLNYSRRVENENASARRAVAAGLNEMAPIIESLWPNQLPEDLSRGTMKALEKETIPETAALLAAFLEMPGRVAVTRGDYSGFENILIGLERVPKDKEHDHMAALAHRLVAQDRWMLLVDAALANRPLNPVLPRLLQRDPERLLDRLTLLLTEPRGAEMLAAMARLLRTIGVPVLNLLETRLYEARRQRVSAAIKLLAAADP